MVPYRNNFVVNFTHKFLFIGLLYSLNEVTCENRSVVNETKALFPPINKLQQEFEIIKNEELQISNLNNFHGSLKLLNKHLDPQKKIEELSQKLKVNIDIIFAALENAKDSFKVHNVTGISEDKHSLIVPCLPIEDDGLSRTDNDSLEYSVNKILDNLTHDLWSIKSIIKQSYYLSLSDAPSFHSSDQVCQIDHSLLWRTYMSHNLYKTRRVIILIDTGNSIEDNVLTLSKQFAKQLIAVLTSNDEFSIISIASKWASPILKESCGNQHLPSILAATDNNKELSYDFIDGLTSMNEITAHSIGMKIAMKMARLFYAEDETVMLVYISSGMEFSMSEAMEIIMTSDLTSPLVINTCAVSLGPLPTVPDMNMLSNIMNSFFIEKNKSKHNQISRGHLVFINDSHLIGSSVAKFYEIYNDGLNHFNVKNSFPMWDGISHDLLVSYTLGFPVGNRMVVIGVDVIFSEFFRDIIYYSNYQKDMYAVLMNGKGTVFIHPSISLPRNEKQMKFADVSRYHENFTTEIFFKKSKGSYHSLEKSLTYTWKHINDIYIIYIVAKDVAEVPVVPSKVSWLPDLGNSQLISYLLEFAGGTTSCKFLGRMVNFDSPSLFLDQNCFKYLLPNSNESATLKLLPYLQPDRLMKKSEGLHDGIRDEVVGLFQIAESLKKKHVTSVNSEYIVRRYVATKSGILHTYPGVMIAAGFEPSKRSWFVRADELRGRLVVSPPYLDAGGAGYIVTISYATSNFVLGIDVTYGYITKLLLDEYPSCMSNNTCFLVDDRGYLISHPDLVGSLGSDSEPIEQLHIVHKESSIANDFLNHPEIVQKLACNDYTSATIQRYYQLNMSYNEILTSLVRGESCISYSIGSIMNTNLFFGVVKAACPITRTFCPCSVIDRICLNCGNMEKQECECPCECHIYRSSCSNYTSHDDYKICDPVLKTYSPDPIIFEEKSEEVESCASVNCESKPNYFSCLGVLGCEWCQKDTYGFPLETPFCAAMPMCFNGVLGGPSPYKDGFVETTPLFTSLKNTGLILGLIIVFGVIFILIFVCWRSRNTPRNQRMYLSARQEEHLHMSDLNINDDFLEQGNHSDKLLIDEKKGTPVSPYCVTSNYSRPTTAADSDHGYSTMTPHDESEHLSLAPVEVDSLEEDMASDKTTPPSKHKVLMTKIPHKNYIIVPVMVHRHVDAT